jgi:hypothetical protein
MNFKAGLHAVATGFDLRTAEVFCEINTTQVKSK